MGVQQGKVCIPAVGVGEGIWFTLRLSREPGGQLICGQLCSRGPGAGEGWGGRAVPRGALERPVGVHLRLQEGATGILQQVAVHHGVINDRVHVGVAVLSSFLTLFWLHWHLGVDVAIVDAYSWPFARLLLPTKRKGTRGSGRNRSWLCSICRALLELRPSAVLTRLPQSLKSLSP